MNSIEQQDHNHNISTDNDNITMNEIGGYDEQMLLVTIVRSDNLTNANDNNTNKGTYTLNKTTNYVT